MRPGALARDTAASVPTTFLLLLLRLKKEDVHLKPLTPGEVARLAVTERAFINAWRANTVYSYLTTDDLFPPPVWEPCCLPLIMYGLLSPRLSE